MTFIQSTNEKNIFRNLFLLLSGSLGVGVFFLILVYNQTVDMRHGIADAKNKMELVQASNAILSTERSGLLGNENLLNLARARGMVQDKAPQYFELTHQWASASHF